LPIRVVDDRATLAAGWRADNLDYRQLAGPTLIEAVNPVLVEG
jgi:hypothetical protein